MISFFGLTPEQVIFLPSAASGVSRVALVPNPGWQRVVFWVSVTVNPGVGETLAIAIRAFLPHGGLRSAVALGAATSFGGIVGTSQLAIGPGISAAWAGGATSGFSNTLLPSQIELTVQHSAAGLWTYTAGAEVS